ncbi:NAD(P)/FAD-dependent oxidoreductase [Paenibacillus vietnamensis]|uniref:NAD(P)/FAD-dependent oxidoreductase n=1 Tax=Paenibacillus vietnamensis TaxID=2590547 RepID=UPI001CD18803|nr:NAD(P)/FAD-dependent oxidoreductase [Paenibacillus vietnamensis]
MKAVEASFDAAVLGAGLAGSSLAGALAGKGWRTLLLDRQTFPRHKVCGEFLSPEAQSTLQALGLYETVAALKPCLIPQTRMVFDGGAELGLELPGTAWGLSRYELDGALHRAAGQAGAVLETGTAVTAIYPGADGYIIEAKRSGKPVRYRARTVIAAWGANAGPGLPGFRPQPRGRRAYLGVKSHFRGLEIEPAVEMYFFRGGYLGLCPVGDGTVNAAALLEQGAFAKGSRSVTAYLEEAAGRNPKLALRLAGAVPVEGTQAAVAPVRLAVRPRTWDTVPLLGDAAAMIAPLCGGGMSMALRSSALCAPLADRYLQGDIDIAGWEREYAHAVRSEFDGPLRLGGMLQGLLGMPAAAGLAKAAAMLAPGLAQGLVRATRLKPFRT